MSSRSRCIRLLSLVALLLVTNCSPLRGQQRQLCPVNDSVAGFLMGMHPQRELRAYELVSRLRYPIHDRASLEVQLDSLTRRAGGTNGDDVLAASVVRASLPATAFPIVTARGALEKLHTGLLAPNQYIERLWIPSPRDFIARPNLYDSLVESFGDDCGRRAYAVYAEVARSNEYQALVEAALEGQRCCRDRGCPPPRRSRR